MRKNGTLNDRMTLPISRELKNKILELKQKGVDHLEWIRQLIATELPKVNEKLDS